MVLLKVILRFGSQPASKTALFVAIFSALFVHLMVSASTDELSTSQTEIASSSSENSTDSTAQESTVKYRKVRNNVLRYGAIYRGNSSIRSTRAFTRRPKASRKDKHRHSTKVDTTKLPLVLLPPILSFRNNERAKVEKDDEPFVINVVSSEQPLTSPSSSTNSYSTYENSPQPSNFENGNQPISNRPFVDEKIMAMKNFGVRMQGKTRGDIKFQTTISSRAESGTVQALNDYTPPPTFFPSAQKHRQVSKQSQRRRTKVRTTTDRPQTNTVVSTEQTSPIQNLFEDGFTQKVVESPTTQSTETIGFENRYFKSNAGDSDFLGGPVDSSASPAYSDFTNSSLADVLNYDIQRTSPRTIFSLDATGPISSVGDDSPHTPPPNDSRFDANTPDARYEGSDFLNENPVSSPGSPSTHLDEYFSNVHESSSSLVPRTEINVATSTSQFVESPTPKTDDEDNYELKDLIFPPLNILAPPFLEDVFHDHLGNVILNATEASENAQQTHVATTPFAENTQNSLANFVQNGASPVSGDWNVSTPPALSTSQPYKENYEENSLDSATQTNDRTTHQGSQFTDCENGECSKNETAARPWTNVPFSPADVKVLSDTDGLALINKMYENLIRVLNGGPDYYDLSEEPQKPEVERGTEPVRGAASPESNNLLAEESGDIRNARQRGRSQNSLAQGGQRTSRRKEIHNKEIEQYQSSEDNQALKKARNDRKASQLCNSKTLSYVADVSSGCKVFYVCTEYGVGEPMLCPNGTLFNQDYLVCDWWYNVECS